MIQHLNTIKGPLITDESFDDYVPTMTDPGSLILIIAIFICGIPICTRLLTKQSRLNIFRRKNSSRMKKKKKMTRDCGCVMVLLLPVLLWIHIISFNSSNLSTNLHLKRLILWFIGGIPSCPHSIRHVNQYAYRWLGTLQCDVTLRRRLSARIDTILLLCWHGLKKEKTVQTLHKIKKLPPWTARNLNPTQHLTPRSLF